MIKEQDLERIKFINSVVLQEQKHLLYSDQQVFQNPLTLEKVESLKTDEVLAEKIEAFGSRFGRFQDSIPN